MQSISKNAHARRKYLQIIYFGGKCDIIFFIKTDIFAKTFLDKTKNLFEVSLTALTTFFVI